MNKYIDLQYFGNINYYNILLKNETINIPSLNWYTKGWFGNKTIISGANGLIELSIPLLGGRNQKTHLKDVRIAYSQPWQSIHKKAIQSCYGNSPFYDYYYYKIENLFQLKKEFLIDWNLKAVETILQILKADTKLQVITNEVVPDDQILLSKQYCKINQCISTLTYQQVFEEKNGFIPNLSILDLLFCTGPQAKDLLKK